MMKKLIAICLISATCFAADKITIYDKSDDMIIGKLPVGEAVQEALDNVTINITTGAITQVIADGTEINVPSGAAVKDAFASATNGITVKTEITAPIGIALWGQSNAEGFPEGTNRLFSAAFTPLTNAWISYIGQYTSADTNAINYQTNLVYYDYTYTADVSWGVELPIGHALSSAGYENYWYKTGIGGAVANTFTNGGTWWKYVTNTYQTATNTWESAPVPQFVIFMRGESGSTNQTQADSYAERLATYKSATNYYGNAGLQFIMTGLPNSYYTNAYGAQIEAGAKELCVSNANCWFVETHDLGGQHYNQDEMIEVANRISAVVNQILAGKKHTQFEQFDKIGATELIADEGQFRELKIKSRPFDEAVGADLDASASGGANKIYDSVYRISQNAIFASAPVPVYSNGIDIVARLYSNVTNAVPGGLTLGSENATLSGGFDSEVGGWVTLTNVAVEQGFYFTDTAITNSDFFVSYWYRREFEPATNDTASGYALYVFNAAANNTAFEIRTRTYLFPLTNPNNITPYVRILDVAGVAVDGYIDFEPPLNEWHHYLFQLDRNGTSSTAQFYVDGVVLRTWNPTNDMTSTPVHATRPVGIGARRYDTTSNLACDGSLSQFVYGKRFLSGREVMSLAAGQPVKGVE